MFGRGTSAGMGILITCFLVGLFVLMLFSEDGRGCLAGIVSLVVGIVGITLLGGLVILALMYLLAEVL